MGHKSLKNIKTLTIVAFAFSLLLASGYSEYLSQKEREDRQYAPLAIVPAELIRATDLGLHSASASLLWLKVIQEVTTWFGPYSRVSDDLTLITELDPQWSYPYAFGTLLLPTLDQEDAGLALGKKGLEQSREDWRIPYYMALVYHTNKADRTNAARYFDIAATLSDAPDSVKKIALIYGTGMNTRDETISIWESIYETSDDDIVRDRAKNHILRLQILNELDTRVLQYEEMFGGKPETLEDLEHAGLIRQTPIIGPFGSHYDIVDGIAVILDI